MASLVGPKKETMDIQTEQPAAPAERPQSGQSSYFTKLYMSKASMHTTPRSRVELKYNETVRKGQLNRRMCLSFRPPSVCARAGRSVIDSRLECSLRLEMTQEENVPVCV